MSNKVPFSLSKNRAYLTISIFLIYTYYIYIIVDTASLGNTLNHSNIKYMIGVLLKASISTLFILILSSVFKLKYLNLLLFIIISIISSIVLFVKIQYGSFELGSYISIMETNTKETIELFNSVDIPLVVLLQLMITPLILFRTNQYLGDLKIKLIHQVISHLPLF